MKWRDDVEKHGKYTSLPRHDTTTFTYQKNQTIHFDGIQICKLNHYKQIGSILDDFLAVLTVDKIYLLDFFGKKDVHAMGCRKLSNGNIEFFDPNCGIFLFEDIKTFTIFYDQLLSNYLFNEVDFQLWIEIIGKQPKNASPSIPNNIVGTENQDLPHLKQDEFKDYSIYLNHLSIIASTHTNEELINSSCRLQNKLIEDLQSKIYTRLAKRSASSLDVTKPAKNAHDDILANHLKKRITDAIDLQIAHLKSNQIENSNKKNIDVLKALKLDIENSQPYQSLTILTEECLSRKNDGGETYKKVLQANRISNESTTYQFILNLTTNYDINTANINLLQYKLLTMIVDIIDLYKKRVEDGLTKSIPTTFNDIDNKLNQVNNSISLHLTNIKNCCSIKSVGIFARIIKGRNKEENDFYNILKKVDVNNPTSLFKAINEMENIFNKMMLEDKKKRSLSNNPKIKYENLVAYRNMI